MRISSIILATAFTSSIITPLYATDEKTLSTVTFDFYKPSGASVTNTQRTAAVAVFPFALIPTG